MNRRILVVDDQPAIVELVSAVLSDEGYEVRGVSDAPEAYPIAKNFAPNVIILDIMMPILNGWDVLKQIRNDEQLAPIPVVLMSAHIRPSDIANIKRQDKRIVGIPKPFDVVDLIEIVDHALQMGNHSAA